MRGFFFIQYIVMVWYFAYGSLMDLNFVKSLGVEFHNAQRGILEGFRFEISVKDDIDSNFGYANIVFDNSSKVEGVLMQITQGQIHFLDQYEGYPSLYNRQRNTVLNSINKPVQAWVYIGTPEFSTHQNLKLTEEQIQRIQNGFDFLSPEYQKHIGSIINQDNL